MAGQNADMTLKVGLDLNFFRQELQKASSALAGQPIDINIRFKRDKISNELRLLSNSLSRKKYDVEVKSTSLEALLKQVNAFKQTLTALKKEDISLDVKVEADISKTKGSEARRNFINAITGGPGKAIIIPTTVKDPLVKNIDEVRASIKRNLGTIEVDVKASLAGGAADSDAIKKKILGETEAIAIPLAVKNPTKTNLDATRKFIKESLSGIIVEVEAKLKGGVAGAKVAATTGKSPAFETARGELARLSTEQLRSRAMKSLGAESRSAQQVSNWLDQIVQQGLKGADKTKQLNAVRDFLADAIVKAAGSNIEARLQPLRGQRQASAARSMPNLNEMLDRMANLTSNPRAAQRMLRALPESRITTNLVGAANRQAAFQQQFPQGFTLPGFNAPKAFDPLLKTIAKDFTEYSKTINTTNPWIGKTGSVLADFITKGVMSSSAQQLYKNVRGVQAQGPALLPAAGQTSASRMTQQMFAGLPALQAPSIGMENAPLSRAGQYMLNKARRALELPVGPASPYAPNPFAGQATVPSRQYFQPTMRPALPAAGGTSGLLSALEAQLGASRGMLGTGGGVAGSLFTGRGLVNPGVSMLEPVGLSGNYRQMAAALANQAANPALAHRQIADIGFGGVPTSATGLSGQALNTALNQAFLQRRGLGTGGAQSMPIFGTGGVAVQQNIPGMAYPMGGGGLGGSMGQFPIAGMMGPSTPLSINARTSMFGGGGGMQPPGGGGGFGGFGGAGGFGRAMGGINLPGAGTIRELGDEFGFATKQVLLFGQAYKLLAFIQDFPAQISSAVSQLQSFRNTLLSVTGNANAAADANEFILAAVEKYSIPLQSARDGFTKLFASMEPAGFAAGEIQNLFLGISKAAATYGLSADKVDRVNYAFAQMASKGQVMSEELKGQLGDVLPGAMGIFAKAAGFEGPDAIQKFGKALEDGEYKGSKMRELLRNVANEMNKEFGPGAEGAARTFQGAINRMQTATAKLYESFEPAAIGIMNAVMVPFVQTLKTATDGINSYFSGQAAATPAAQDFANVLKTLVPTLTGIGENLKYVFQQVAVLIQGFGAFALQVGRLLALPIVRYLAGAYVQTLLLTTAFKALATSGLGAALVAIGRFIAQGVVYAQVTLGMRVATQQTTVAMYQFGTAVQTVMIKSIIGIALVAISSFIARIVELRGQLAAISGDAKSMEDLAKSSAKLGDVGATKEAVGNIRDRAESYKELREQIQAAKKAEGMKGEGATAGMTQDIKLTTALGNKMVELGLINKRVLQTSSNGYKVNELALDGVLTKINENIASFDKAGQKGEQYINQAIKQNQKLKEQGGLGLDGPDEKAAEKARREAEKLANQQQQAAIDAANSQNALNKAIMEGRMSLDDQAFQHQLALIDARNSYELAGLNSIQARQEKFQQDLQKLELDRINIVRKAEQNATKAIAEYKAAQNTAVAAEGGSSGQVGGNAMFGDTGRTFNAAGWVHGHFQNMNRAALVSDTVDVVMKLLSQGVSPELGSGARFKQGMSQEQITSLVKQGIASHKSYASGTGAIDVFVPKGTQVPVPLSGVGNLGGAAGITGMLPGGTQLMHLDPRSRSGGGYTQQRRTEKAGGKLEVEQTQMYMEAEKAAREAVMATTEALEKRKALIAANIDAIFPVAQQRLENDLLKVRNDLQLKGMPEEYIKYQEDLAKVNYEMGERIKGNIEETAKYGKEVAVLQERQQNGTKLTETEKQALDFYTQAIVQNKDELNKLTEQQKQYQIVALESAIATMKNADAMKAMQEIAGRIEQAVGGITGTYKEMFKEIAKGGDSVEALKKAQEALADQALTMFFDFAMKPVEKFFTDQLGAIFGLPNEEEQRKATLAKMQEQLVELQAIKVATQATANNAAGGIGGGIGGGTQQNALAPGGAIMAPGDAINYAEQAASKLPETVGSITDSVNAYSEQLGKVNASVWENAAEIAPEGGAGKKWQESLGKVVGGLGMAAGSVMGIVAGINQIKEGGTSNVLGGIGMIASMAGSLLGGFSGLFGGGSSGMFGTSSSFNGTADALSAAPFAPKIGGVFANGGIAKGGFRAFANGGVVGGPTLGLMGEGKYNEAIVPLPDGKSIPVTMNGGQSSRNLLSNGAAKQGSSPVLSMSFQSTTINGVEYVDRAQLEAAMAETRRLAARDGASQGSQLALNKLKNSPTTRRQLGF